LEPLVSVICITRNHERFCIESLDSVLNQTYKNIEWIILDAASTDGTVDLIDNWLVENNVHAVFLKEKVLKPITVNLNKALTYAHGEYVQFLSLDDVLLPNKFTRQLDIFKNSNENLGMVFGNAIFINSAGSKIRTTYFQEKNRINRLLCIKTNSFDTVLEGAIINAPTMLIKTECLIGIGGIDTTLAFEDLDLILRITRKYSLDFVNECVVEYRILKNSLSRSKDVSYYKSRIKVFEKHLDIKSKKIKVKIWNNIYETLLEIRKKSNFTFLYMSMKLIYQYGFFLMFFDSMSKSLIKLLIKKIRMKHRSSGF
jgi:glycosyltransferase involved in cell wall biosynthesis